MPAPPGARPPFATENTWTGVVRSPMVLSGPDKVAAIAQVNHLERLLFDDPARRGTSLRRYPPGAFLQVTGSIQYQTSL
jgi:hypothetical protein